MAFCGNCGLQLPPRSAACPRCGTPTDTRLAMEESHPNDPTIAVLPASGDPTSQPGTELPTIQATPTPLPSTQPTYISQPGATVLNSGQPTNAPTYITPLPPVAPQASDRSSYPGFPGYPPSTPTSGANYAPTVAPQASSPAQGVSSPGYPSPGSVIYQPIEAAYAPGTQRRQNRSGQVALILFFVALLFVGGALGILLAKREGILFNNATPTTAASTPTGITSTQTAVSTQTPTPTPTPTPPPTTVPLTEQAQTLLENYYSDINNRDYQDAYAMLGTQMQAQQQSYANYVNGFANTQHDIIAITSTTQQADGTIRLDVTLNATNTDGSTQSYTGYYIIGMENGSLKILSGKLQQA